MPEAKTDIEATKQEQLPQIAPEQLTGCNQYHSLISKYDWDINIAMAIMEAESHCDRNADNTGLNEDGTNDKGLMQINSIHADLITDLDRFVPVKNIQAGYEIYRGGGWGAWSTYNNGSYLDYL